MKNKYLKNKYLKNKSIKKPWLIFAVVGVFNSLFIQGVAAQAVYNNDFSAGAGPEWSDPATNTSRGQTFLAPYNPPPPSTYAGAGTNTLSLSGLPPHTDVTVSFDLYIIRFWDGNGENGFGPDPWQLTADGGLVFRSNFATQSGSGGPITQAYPAELAPIGVGALNPPGTGGVPGPGINATQLNNAWTYRITRTFSHTGDSIALGFTSQQTGSADEESWGLDNVTVTVSGADPTPVPALPPFALFALAVITALFGGRFLRKK